jgi:hypothetical protein
MGTNPRNTTAGRTPRGRASIAIAVVAVAGLLTACTAASAGAVRPAPDRYWTAAGAAATTGAAKPTPDRYWTAAGAAVKAQTSAETQQSLRLEHMGKVGANVTLSAGTVSEYESLRNEHRSAK